MTKRIKKPINAITSEMQELFATNLGPGRFARTAYRLREQASTKQPLGVNIFENDKLIGTVSLTELRVGEKHKVYLLGPLLIAEEHRSNGLGLELIHDAIELAKTNAADAVLLVGDSAYYEKAGFKQIAMGQIKLPGPVDPARLLMFEINNKPKTSDKTRETIAGTAKAV